jgi:hypothetical protein
MTIDAALRMTIVDDSKSPVTHSARKSLKVSEVLDTPKSLSPLHLYAKTVERGRYWPNNGRSYPASFYQDPPAFAVQLHVLHDAVSMPNGDVIGAGGRSVSGGRDGRGVTSSEQYENVKLTRYFCIQEVGNFKPKTTCVFGYLPVPVKRRFTY